MSKYGTITDNQLYPGATRKAAGLTNAVRRVQSTATTFTKQQRTFFRNRRICVSRGYSVVPVTVTFTNLTANALMEGY